MTISRTVVAADAASHRRPIAALLLLLILAAPGCANGPASRIALAPRDRLPDLAAPARNLAAAVRDANDRVLRRVAPRAKTNAPPDTVLASALPERSRTNSRLDLRVPARNLAAAADNARQSWKRLLAPEPRDSLADSSPSRFSLPLPLRPARDLHVEPAAVPRIPLERQSTAPQRFPGDAW